jgi:hypothetical protein
MVGFCTGFVRILQMLVNARARSRQRPDRTNKESRKGGKTISTRRREGAETQSREDGEEARWRCAAADECGDPTRLRVGL